MSKYASNALLKNKNVMLSELTISNNAIKIKKWFWRVWQYPVTYQFKKTQKNLWIKVEAMALG